MGNTSITEKDNVTGRLQIQVGGILYNYRFGLRAGIAFDKLQGNVTDRYSFVEQTAMYLTAAQSGDEKLSYDDVLGLMDEKFNPTLYPEIHDFANEMLDFFYRTPSMTIQMNLEVKEATQSQNQEQNGQGA